MTYFDRDLILDLKLAYEYLKKQSNLCMQNQFNESDMLQGQGRIISDSREVKPGDIFIAYKGENTDSHQFIGKVIDENPGLIITEAHINLEHLHQKKVPILVVKNSRKAWSYLCALACGNPQNKMTNIAITGTNGKTSTLWMLKSLLESHKIRHIAIGTLGIYIDSEHFSTKHTTPDPPTLYLSIKLALEKGVRVLAMEASSHSIAQEKLAPISFNCLAWTSFSQDHLDFHKTMEAYWKVKWSLFTEYLAASGRSIINKNIDPFPPCEKLDSQDVITYGLEKDGRRPSLVASELVTEKDGSEVSISYQGSNYKYKIPYWGDHNIENFLCALAIFEKTQSAMPLPNKTAKLQGVPGRLQRVPTSKQNTPCVLIDYAHTPDALKKTILAIKPYCNGEVFVVFGCGGERDRDKRQKMGSIAESLADKVIITSDNPRHEPSIKILEDIQTGFLTSQPVMIEDRKSAITWAIKHAKVSDFILVAGKGHEAYQIIGSEVLDFDDYQVAKAVLDAE